jgi:hypothetical protein
MPIQTAIDSISNSQGSPFGFKNRIINGAMVIDQRNAGASLTPGTSFVYNIDRWYTYASQSSKISVQRNAGSVTPPAGFNNYLGVTSLSAFTPASGDQFLLGQSIEGYNVADLDWGTSTAKDVTLSFWVRSSLTGQFSATIESQDGNNAYVATYTINASNTWEYKSLTIPGRKTGTWEKTLYNGMYVLWNLGNGTTFQTGSPNSWVVNINAATGDNKIVSTNGATFYITGVQLEKGTQATAFDYRDYGNELRMCQRYCMAWRIDGVAQQYLAVGQAYNTTTAIFTVPLPVTPRVTPTGITTSAAAGFGSLTSGAGGSTGSTLVFNSSSNMALTIIYTATAGFTTAGFATALYFNGTAGAYIITTGSEL